MDSHANYRLVGAFILLVSIALIVSLLWLTNLSDRHNAAYYTIYFKNYSLSGLQKDSYVTMRGITVGSVVDYNISPKSVEEVKVTIRLDPHTPVMTTTEAIITRNLLTGLAAVELTGAKDSGELLTTVREDELYPVIPEGSSTFDQIADSIPEFLENMGNVVARAQSLLSDENLTSVENTLNAAERFTLAANDNITEVDEVLKNINTLSKSLTKTSDQLASLTTESSEDIRQALKELRTSLTLIRESFEQLQVQTEEVSGSLIGASHVLSQQVVTVGQSLSEAAESVSQTAESFENPRRILTGPSQDALGPGEQLAE